MSVDLNMLIELVSSHSHLYDVKSKNYKDNDMKENSWQEISIVMEISVDDCKRLWKNLRDRFTKEKRIMKLGNPPTETRWAYFKKMLFYDKYCTPRKTVSATFSSHSILQCKNENRSLSPTSSRSCNSFDINKSATIDIEEVNVEEAEILYSNLSKSLGLSTDCEIPRKKMKKDVKNDLDEVVKVPTKINEQSGSSSNVNESFAMFVANRLNEMTAQEAKGMRRKIIAIIDE